MDSPNSMHPRITIVKSQTSKYSDTQEVNHDITILITSPRRTTYSSTCTCIYTNTDLSHWHVDVAMLITLKLSALLKLQHVLCDLLQLHNSACKNTGISYTVSTVSLSKPLRGLGILLRSFFCKCLIFLYISGVQKQTSKSSSESPESSWVVNI